MSGSAPSSSSAPGTSGSISIGSANMPPKAERTCTVRRSLLPRIAFRPARTVTSSRAARPSSRRPRLRTSVVSSRPTTITAFVRPSVVSMVI